MDTQELTNKLLELVATGAVLAIVLLLRIGINALNKWLAIKTGNETVDLLKKLAQTVVQTLQQTDWTQLTNEQKKEKALLLLQAETNKFGLKVDFDQIDRVIEEAVHQMKQSPVVVVSPEKE
jgi:LL-H family phage holin